jgi:undecaprenyl-diphosphatase
MQDIDLLTWLNHNLIPFSLPVLRTISFTTTAISISLVLIVLIISVHERSEPLRRKFYILISVLIFAAIVSQGLKQLIYRERPFITHPSIEKFSDGGGSSFPSGHTLEAFAMATALSLLFSKKKIVIPVFAWAILVAYSRIALGVHYPSDVIAGILLGIFIGWIIPRVYRRIGASG